MQFFYDRFRVVMTGFQEKESCSPVLTSLERMDDRTGCTHTETTAVVKPRVWEDIIGDNKGLAASSASNLQTEYN